MLGLLTYSLHFKDFASTSEFGESPVSLDLVVSSDDEVVGVLLTASPEDWLKSSPCAKSLKSSTTYSEQRYFMSHGYKKYLSVSNQLIGNRVNFTLKIF